MEQYTLGSLLTEWCSWSPSEVSVAHENCALTLTLTLTRPNHGPNLCEEREMEYNSQGWGDSPPPPPPFNPSTASIHALSF